MGEDVAKALDIKHQVKQQRKLKQTKNQTTMQPPRECKGRVKVACSSDGRSRAGWRRREHACQPSEGEGTACSKGWKVLRNYETSTYIEELATKRSAWWEELLKVGIKRIVSEINNVLKLRNASVKQESLLQPGVEAQPVPQKQQWATKELLSKETGETSGSNKGRGTARGLSEHWKERVSLTLNERDTDRNLGAPSTNHSTDHLISY